MRKYGYVRFCFYYTLMLLSYLLQPLLLFIKEFVFFDDEDIIMFNQLVMLFVGVMLCLQYVLSIIPTITYFRMNEGKDCKRYWYSSVFDKKKVYGPLRKILIGNIFTFLIIEMTIIILRISQGKNIFIDFCWMPIVAFTLSFGVVALESGVLLHLHNEQMHKNM